MIFVANAAWALEPFKVQDIRVEGLQRVEPGTVFASMPLRVGDDYNDEKGAAAIRALFGLGLFKDVRLEASGNVLVVVVEESPTVADVDFAGALGVGEQAAGLGHLHRLLGVGRGRVAGQATQLSHQVGVGLQVGQRDDLADLGVGVAAGATAAPMAAGEQAAARAPADVGLLGAALGHGDLFGRTHVGDRQHHVGGLLLEVQPADHTTDVAAHQPAQQAADGVAARVAVLRDQVGHQHVVRRTDLALADVGAVAQLAAGGQVALGHRRTHAHATVHQREAARLVDEDLDQLRRCRQLLAAPPVHAVLRLDHRDRAQRLAAGRDFGHLLLALVLRALALGKRGQRGHERQHAGGDTYGLVHSPAH